jgi:hypothetical protein
LLVFATQAAEVAALGAWAAFVGWFVASAAAQGYERVVEERRERERDQSARAVAKAISEAEVTV